MQTQRAASHTAYGALYLVGNRQVTRIDLQTGVKKEWPLLAVVGIKAEDICSARHVPVTCDWSASEAVVDVANQRPYLAAPTTPPKADPESDTDGRGRGLFAVWAVDLQTMKLLHSAARSICKVRPMLC
jgi:hypothetical protein